jgi:cytoskeleton protein RodZ
MRETGLPSFGEKLKQEREKRKITLEQISVSTKIGTRMLQALEEDKFNQLPGGIFNKGFVRAYARFVGIDEDQTVTDYLQASGDAPSPRTEIVGRDGAPENDEENVSRIEADADTPTRPLPWGLFAGILLLIALALSFWSHHQRELAKQSVSTVPIASAAHSPGGASDRDSGSGSATTPTSKTASPASRLAPTNSPAAASAPTRSTSSAASSTTSSSTSPATVKTSQATTTATPAAPGEFTVLIQVREESWVSITADGKRIESELLPAGTERSVHGRKQIIVKAGNAGGVDFHLNGKKLDTAGEYGEVKTVTFGPEGIVPNAPGAPLTP